MAKPEYGPLYPYTVVQEDRDGARPETATYRRRSSFKRSMCVIAQAPMRY